MELPILIESLAPWLGGGAVTVVAGFTVWLWLQYHKREGSQWSRNEQLLADTQRDRDYWREMAIDRQKEINHLQDLIAEIDFCQISRVLGKIGRKTRKSGGFLTTAWIPGVIPGPDPGPE